MEVASPFAMITDQGVELDLTALSPRLLGWHLQQATQRKHERHFTAKLLEKFASSRPDLCPNILQKSCGVQSARSSPRKVGRLHRRESSGKLSVMLFGLASA